jgi:hypothetical protein
MAFEAIRRAFTQAPIGGLSPQEIERRRKQSEGIYAPGRAVNGLGVLAEGLKGVFGGLEDRRLNKAEREGRERNTQLIMAALGMVAPPAGGMGSTNPHTPSRGGNNYRDAISAIESGGRYDAIGPTDAELGRPLGRYQVMEANVGPWSQQVLGRSVTPDEFLASPEIQDQIFDGIFGGYVQQYGPEGAAQAWFGGPGAVGRTGRSDVLGTTVGEYGQRFMQGIGGAPSTGAPPQVAQNAQEVNPAILQALMDPWTDPSMQGVLADLYTQQTTPREPNLINAGGGQIYNADTGEWISAPQSADSIDPDGTVGQFYDAKRLSLIPPEMTLEQFYEMNRQPGTTVNVGPNGAQLPNPPNGFSYLYNPDGTPQIGANGLPTLAPIPGGPEDTSAQDAARDAQTARTSDVVTQDIDRALGIIGSQGWNATGIGGQITAGIAGTPGHDLNQLLTTIGGNLAFDKLQAMRQSSPTGGALGSVTERELAMLQSTLGAIAQSQSQQQLTDNLNRLWNQYQDVIHGPGQGPSRRQLSFDQGANPLLDPGMMGAPQSFQAPPGAAPPAAAPTPMLSQPRTMAPEPYFAPPAPQTPPAAGPAPAPPQAQQGASPDAPIMPPPGMTEANFDAFFATIPTGAFFVGPDGQLYRKN